MTPPRFPAHARYGRKNMCVTAMLLTLLLQAIMSSHLFQVICGKSEGMHSSGGENALLCPIIETAGVVDISLFLRLVNVLGFIHCALQSPLYWPFALSPPSYASLLFAVSSPLPLFFRLVFARRSALAPVFGCAPTRPGDTFLFSFDVSSLRLFWLFTDRTAFLFVFSSLLLCLVPYRCELYGLGDACLGGGRCTAHCDGPVRRPSGMFMPYANHASNRFVIVGR